MEAANGNSDGIHKAASKGSTTCCGGGLMKVFRSTPKTNDELLAGRWNGVRGTRLAGHVAIVTGAGSQGPGWGTGKAIAVAMAREGASVGLVDLNPTAAAETAAIIRGEGGRCALLPKCDVSKVEEVEAMVSACEKELGSISILVNNVGLVCPGDCTSVPLEKWEMVNNVNLLGPFNAIKACIPRFLASGRGGNIINIGSISAIRVLRAEVTYASTKGALNSLTLSVAREFARNGIRCNCVLPGIIETPLVHNMVAGPDSKRTLSARDQMSPTGKMGDAWDIAYAAVYLASSEARYANGLIMPVDGAYTQQILPHQAGAQVVMPSAPAAQAVVGSRRFEGKVAVVFGANTEYGRAVVNNFNENGARVFNIDHGQDADMSSSMINFEHIKWLVDKCKNRYNRVDYLVTCPFDNGNAGGEFAGGVEATSSEEFAARYRRDATGVLCAMRAVVPIMLEQSCGSIVNISSISSVRYVRPDVVGAAAFGSVNTQTIQAAAEFALKGIRCNAVIPFAMEDLGAKDGLASDAAKAALHLCSEESRYTSGQLLYVDLSASYRVTVNTNC